jgi:hypothetical protein
MVHCRRHRSASAAFSYPIELGTAKVEPPAFHLHTWFPGTGFGSLVTHQVPIGQFDGPHLFFGPDGKLL